MKDRLIEVLGDFSVWHSTLKDNWMPEAIERLADHLLANGVIVPPCKVGEKIYVVRFGKCEEHIVEKIEQCRNMLHVAFGWRNMGYEWISVKEFGQTVFLTREEAEKSLSGEVVEIIDDISALK